MSHYSFQVSNTYYIHENVNMKTVTISENKSFKCLFLFKRNTYIIINDKYTYLTILKHFRPTINFEKIHIFNLKNLSRKFNCKTYQLKDKVLTLTRDTEVIDHKNKEETNHDKSDFVSKKDLISINENLKLIIEKLNRENAEKKSILDFLKENESVKVEVRNDMVSNEFGQFTVDGCVDTVMRDDYDKCIELIKKSINTLELYKKPLEISDPYFDKSIESMAECAKYLSISV